jgi:cytosine/adenosine deaminase-related metal-dependent hydrolase
MDLKVLLHEGIRANGGWVNTHAHLDRAYTLDKDNYRYINSHLKDKWHLVDTMKKTSTVDQIYDRMARATEFFIAQGCQALGTFIDVDEIIEDKAIIAAQRLRERFGNDIKLKFANQVLKGVIDPKARYWYDLAVQFVDIIGGLPAKDAPYEADHLDVLIGTGKALNKWVHVHVDQFNNSDERETELLARKTIEHGMQGMVAGVHGISIGAHPAVYRNEVYHLMKEANLAMIACPLAWIDHTRNERLAPSHNSVTPIDEMVPAGITVALGTDNIADIYKPFADGDMWIELRLLLESCRYYHVEDLIKISTTNGLRVLGIEK